MYIKKTTYLNGKIRIQKHHTWNFGTVGLRRGRREKPTDLAVEKANERKAKETLEDLININFNEGDWFVTLTYKPEGRPDPEESRKILQKFLSKMRRYYKSKGQELKYIQATEWNATKIHHHIVMNNVEGISTALVNYWPHGGRHMEPLYADHDYEALAEYMVKETSETFRDKDNPYRKRYSPSRNLKKPEIDVEIIKSNTWRSEPKLTKELTAAGWYIEKGSLCCGLDALGYPYQSYIVITPKRSKVKKC